MTLSKQVLKESLFYKWLSETGDADCLDIPTRQIEEELRKVIDKALLFSQAEVLKEIEGTDTEDLSSDADYILEDLKKRLLAKLEPVVKKDG